MGNRSRNVEQQKIEKDRVRQKKIVQNKDNKLSNVTKDEKTSVEKESKVSGEASPEKISNSMVLDRNEKLKILLISFGIMAALIILDQITKDLMIMNYSVGHGLVIIKGFFELLHIQNKGSAWGAFNDKPIVPIIISCILIIFIIYIYANIIKYRKYKSLRICIVFLLSGALSNIIDRIRLGAVTDFIYFKLIDFPVFNVADIYVTISMMFMLLMLIFTYNGNDLDIMLGNGYLDEKGEFKEKAGK
ncbi:MAG: signal peptidase II [Eubacterium sp.]|nr:signal peptidase II [Eubacterium sp.]